MNNNLIIKERNKFLMILPPDFTNILNKFEESIDNRLIKNSPIDLPNNITKKGKVNL